MGVQFCFLQTTGCGAREKIPTQEGRAGPPESHMLTCTQNPCTDPQHTWREMEVFRCSLNTWV